MVHNVVEVTKAVDTHTQEQYEAAAAYEGEHHDSCDDGSLDPFSTSVSHRDILRMTGVVPTLVQLSFDEVVPEHFRPFLCLEELGLPAPSAEILRGLGPARKSMGSCVVGAKVGVGCMHGHVEADLELGCFFPISAAAAA